MVRMNLLTCITGLLMFPALLQSVLSQDIPFQPYVMDWKTLPNASPADVSFLLEAPAGKSGFIRSSGGHLVFPDGARFRIWGFNITGQATIPPKKDAPIIAERLARTGINCLRFHFLDLPAPRGLIDANREDTRALDTEALDRLDFFIAELKQQGVYANLNLNVGRRYKAGDGVQDYTLIGVAKALTYFDDRLLELQKEYARQLLTHRNPYTDTEYRHEPAVAIVEFVNENSIMESWINNRLLGENTQVPGAVWTDITAHYAQDLTRRYNAWLQRRLDPSALMRFREEAGAGPADVIPRLRREEFDKASEERFRTEAAFYMEIERDYFREMGRYLREDLGVQSLLVGTSDHGHARSSYPTTSSMGAMDVIDGHVYWQHPSYTRDESGRTTAFTIRNTPMVDSPLNATVVQLARTAMTGKPYTVSEVNHPFPSEWACEGVPLLASYAAFQDWDGIFWYTLNHSDLLAMEPSITGHFDFACDPVKMTQLAAGALTFLRGDVNPASQTVERSYSQKQVIDGLRLPASEGPFFTPGFDVSTVLQHAVRIASFTGEQQSGTTGSKQTGLIVSDTGELQWRNPGEHQGLVTIETPRTNAVIGFVKATPARLRHLSAVVDNPHCAITLSSLDEKPIAAASRLLLSTGARVANTGQQWNAERTTLQDWGKPPTLIEPVTGRITLLEIDGARGISIQPLDGAGQPMGTMIQGQRASGGWTFPIGSPATPWYVITVQR